MIRELADDVQEKQKANISSRNVSINCNGKKRYACQGIALRFLVKLTGNSCIHY